MIMAGAGSENFSGRDKKQELLINQGMEGAD